MKKRNYAQIVAALAMFGLVGCEANGGFGENSAPNQTRPTTQSGIIGQSTSSSGKSYKPDFDKAELSSDRADGQAKPLDTKLFVMEAASCDNSEIQLGRLALTKSNNPTVRQFANQMIQGHQNMANQLKQIAQARNLIVQSTPLPEDEKINSELLSLKGADFDRQYLESQVRAHEKTIQTFQSSSQQLPDAEVRAFASQNLPVLQEHLKMAQQDLRNLGSNVQ